MGLLGTTMAAPMLATTVEATLVNSPNKSRLRNLSMKISAMGDELSQEKQARADAVELKLKVLDDKLLRAQIAEEDKLKPLNEQIARYVEELSAERLSREVMDERKTKEIKAVESSVSLDLTSEKRARKDLESKVIKLFDETAFSLRLDLAREKKLTEEAEERHEKEVADEIIRIADSVDQERKQRL